LGAPGDERLDDAVLKRMERNDDQPAAGLENAFGGLQRQRQFAELVVDENARGRMNLVGLGAHDAADDVGERARGDDRRLGARLDDGASDAARMALLA